MPLSLPSCRRPSAPRAEGCRTVCEPAASWAHCPGSQRRGQVRRERSGLKLRTLLPLLPCPELPRWIWVSSLTIPCQLTVCQGQTAPAAFVGGGASHTCSLSLLWRPGEGRGDLPMVTQQVRDGLPVAVWGGWGAGSQIGTSSAEIGQQV